MGKLEHKLGDLFEGNLTLIQFQTEKVWSDVWTKSIYSSNLTPAQLGKSDRQALCIRNDTHQV